MTTHYTYRVTSARTGKTLVCGSGRVASAVFSDVIRDAMRHADVAAIKDSADPIFPAPARFYRGGVPVFLSVSPVADSFTGKAEADMPGD